MKQWGNMLYAKTFKIRLSEEFRQEDETLLNDFLESVIPEKIESGLVQHPGEPFWSTLVIYQPLEDLTTHEGDRILFDSYEPLSEKEELMFMRLKAWRDRTALEKELPRYKILHDAHLRTLVKLHPTSHEDFAGMKGLPQRKIEKYAETLLKFFR